MLGYIEEVVNTTRIVLQQHIEGIEPIYRRKIISIDDIDRKYASGEWEEMLEISSETNSWLKMKQNIHADDELWEIWLPIPRFQYPYICGMGMFYMSLMYKMGRLALMRENKLIMLVDYRKQNMHYY